MYADKRKIAASFTMLTPRNDGRKVFSGHPYWMLAIEMMSANTPAAVTPAPAP